MPPGFVDYRAHQGEVLDTDAVGIKRFANMIHSHFSEDQRPRIKVSTTHGFKGLQGKVVVVLDAVAGRYPLIHPDWIYLRVLGESLSEIVAESRRLFYVAVTRAADTLIIFTDQRRQSPFLENLREQIQLPKINWAEFPPVTPQTGRLIVMVGNQPYRGSDPTLGIKELLIQEDYRYSNTKNWPCWMKSFAVDDFSLDLLKKSTWSSSARGVEIRILDDRGTLIEKHMIDDGRWQVA
jgi:DNA helicase IV